jgi:hypothetical protein
LYDKFVAVGIGVEDDDNVLPLLHGVVDLEGDRVIGGKDLIKGCLSDVFEEEPVLELLAQVLVH